MNTKNYLGLLAIIPLFTVAFATVAFEEAQAVGGLGIEEAKERAKTTETQPDVRLVLKQIVEPTESTTESQKSYKGFHEEQSDTTKTFKTVYRIQNEGEDDVWNVEILVESDIDAVDAKLQGKLDTKRSTVTVSIKALDPESINAKIVGFQA